MVGVRGTFSGGKRAGSRQDSALGTMPFEVVTVPGQIGSDRAQTALGTVSGFILARCFSYDSQVADYGPVLRGKVRTAQNCGASICAGSAIEVEVGPMLGSARISVAVSVESEVMAGSAENALAVFRRQHLARHRLFCVRRDILPRTARLRLLLRL